MYCQCKDNYELSVKDVKVVGTILKILSKQLIGEIRRHNVNVMRTG